MRFVDRKDLPVHVLENELPQEEGKKYKMFYNSRVRTSGGFADAVFLAAIMVVCFMWGMLAIILR